MVRNGDGLFQFVFPFEALNTTGGVDEFLLPGEEGVASRADIEIERFDG